MNIETKLSLGDTVWKVWNGTESYWQPCEFCAATGQVSSADGNTVRPCPECYGRRGETKWRPKAWRIEGPYTVGQVRVEITDSPGLGDESIFDNYKPQHGREERYMLVETGIGSGTLHDAADLFTGEDDARAACRERNAPDEQRQEAKHLTTAIRSDWDRGHGMDEVI